ncbi:MAG: IS110 family transposase [Lachnospiraceae bacterium]|nr:IS110 family transposase [Lachnospiraceae bacterium]
MNRLHRELKIYFPEYKEAYGKVDGAFSLALLKEAPFPKDILKLGTAGIREIWHNAKLRGRGYAKAEELVRYAEESIGLKEGAEENREPVKWYAEEITRLTEKLSEIEEKLHQKCMEIPHTENVLEIPGIGENIMGGILSELGDISRFDDAKELQKLSGLGLVACSSGKHTGETRISRRGRKRLRYWLFQGARSAVAHGLVWNMIDKRVKATMSKVQEEIAPFVKKHVFSRDTVDAKYIRQIAVLFLHQYNNVSICQGLERKDGKPWLKITVKTFPFSEDKILEVTGIPKEKKNNNLDWIDHIEECEAFMDD